jgi:hypothetical protein
MRTWLLTIFAATMACLLFAVSAQAQATRTWVSGVGDDANPCSRTAPCKTFAGSISKTATFGEINCLDEGGFGAVTITKSIGIICDQMGTAGILVSGTNGIVISVATTDTVVLRGLDFEGITTGLSGILMIGTGGTLHVEKCLIRGFNSSSAGFGVNISPSNNVSVTIQDSTIASNGTGGIGAGITIAPTGGTTTVNLNNVRVVNNTAGMLVKPSGGAVVNLGINGSHIDSSSGGGLRIDGTNGGPIATAIFESTVNFSGGNGINAIAGSSLNIVNIKNSVLSENGGAGAQANGGNAGVLLSATLLNQNVAGATSIVGGGNMFTYGNNEIVGSLGAGFNQTAHLQ